MYKVTWDVDTGGVLLHTHNVEGVLGVSPRPVFFEELDMLGLDSLGWAYPRGREPLMWAVNKQYWYRGRHLFDVKGADIYTPPVVALCDGVSPGTLTPVDVRSMLDKTSALMFVLESEAVEFIRDTYTAYTKVNRTFEKDVANRLDYEALAANAEKRSKRRMAVVKEDCDSFDVMPLATARNEGRRVLLSTKIDRFIASFSGGKDSQVVLDLCTRAIPPADFTVIYSDTGYELPPSLELYEVTKRLYSRRFPSLKFLTARNHESVLNYWDEIGTPSDRHRWCCSVMKTVPLYRKLLEGSGKRLKFLAFEGVRAEESVRRSDYDRIGKGVKHSFVVNARPILRWNTTEVFLYLFRHRLPLNQAYRMGKPRVGCILCPFGSPWDDMVVNRCYHDKLAPFLSRIESNAESRKIPNKKEYIAERRWKLRGSGAMVGSTTSVTVSSSPNRWEATVRGGRKSLFLWLPTVGTYSVHRTKDDISGELMFERDVFQFEVHYAKAPGDFTFVLHDDNCARLRFLLRRVVNKSAYCINCESCELECAYGALSVYPEVKVDAAKCVHCHKCLEYHNVGCIVADSLIKPVQTNISSMKISKYGTFGIHQDWVDDYLGSPETFWTDNSLGKKQVPSFKAWLKDAEIIDDSARLTPFGRLCRQIGEESDTLLWEAIYVNLAHNSPMMKWFVSAIGFNDGTDRKALDRQALDFFQPAFKETTVTYAVQALVQTFRYSPIGGAFGQFVPQGAGPGVFVRQPYDSLSPEALAYSLYKYARTKDVAMLRVSDLYRQEETAGPYREFGVSRAAMARKLRLLSSESNRVLVAELNMGLDHITLRDDLTPLAALEMLVR